MTRSAGSAAPGHKAQGLTCEHTYTLGTETLYREWGYVAMSRGRLTNQLYHGPVCVGDDGLHHHVHLDDVPDLTSRLRRSRAQQPITPEIAQLASDWRATLRYLASKAVQQQPHVHAEHDRTSRERAAVVRRIEGLERQQAPTVGPALRRGARARRASVAAELERQRGRLQRLDGTLEQLDQRLARLPTTQQIAEARTQLRDLDTQLRHHSRTRAVHLAADPPPYLLAVVGPAPSDRRQRDQWFRAIEEIEDHRLRWGISDPTHALGRGSNDDVHEVAHRRLQQLLEGFGPDRQVVQRSRGHAR
jgi:hypothetical protein